MLCGKSSTSIFSRLFLFSLFSILSLTNRFDASLLSTSALRVHAFPLPYPESAPLQGANSSGTRVELGDIEVEGGKSTEKAEEPEESGKEGEKGSQQLGSNNTTTGTTTKDRHRSSRPLHLVDPPSPPAPAPAPSSIESAHRLGPGPGVSSIPLIQRPISPSYIHRIQEQYAQAAAAGTTRSSTGGIPGWNPLWGIGPVVPPPGSHLFDALTTVAEHDNESHAAEDDERARDRSVVEGNEEADKSDVGRGR